MKQKNEKNGSILDYSISILLMLILALSTYLAPFAYSNFSDNKDMREAHAVGKREGFSFRDRRKQCRRKGAEHDGCAGKYQRSAENHVLK